MGSSDKEIIYKYMAAANRPFSSNDVFTRLKRQSVGKSAVDKALDELVQENKIVMKLNGKQKIYCVVQPDSAAEDQRQVRVIDEDLVKMTETARLVGLKLKQSDAEVKELQGTLSREEISSMVDEMAKTVAELETQVARLSANASGITSPLDREQVIMNYARVNREYRNRKRTCMDMLNLILENCPKPREVLFEEIGVETDESVNMPSLQ